MKECLLNAFKSISFKSISFKSSHLVELIIMNSLKKMPNIGGVLAQKLELAGIKNPADLRNIGCEKAFIMLNTIDKDSCICSLYALEGAIHDIRWHNLPQARKDELKQFYGMCKK